MHCEMEKDCKNPVTHIGEKGYVYCATHAPDRKGWERTRRMRPWELKLIATGKPLPSYKPLPKGANATSDATKLKQFVSTIARMKLGSEYPDGQEPENDDYVTTLTDLIEQARALTGERAERGVCECGRWEDECTTFDDSDAGHFNR